MDSVPEYAAVSETVDMAKKLARGREGFINGVLRGYIRSRNILKTPERGADAAKATASSREATSSVRPRQGVATPRFAAPQAA